MEDALTGVIITVDIPVGSKAVTDLDAVANAQTVGIMLINVSEGLNVGDVFVPFSVLAGDTSGNGSVTATDVGQTKARSGQTVSGLNFRSDVT